MKQVLIVCTGNVCRSPMATGLLQQRLGESGLADQVSVSSAGVFGLDGAPASRPGVQVLAERGMDISGHRAHTVTADDMRDADLVLVMEEAHRRSLFYSYPNLLGKVFLYSEMAGEYDDIEDPYRQPKEEYAKTADELSRLLDQGYPEILRRLGLADS
ncbi:MAG: low molecular weight protein arginine phosphatase [Chloroflexota bacterium]|nr:low molecular weight protein arginine phosphatase [Chloroflexota bacterium]